MAPLTGFQNSSSGTLTKVKMNRGVIQRRNDAETDWQNFGGRVSPTVSTDAREKIGCS